MAALYEGAYRRVEVEFREERAPSSWPRRKLREWRKVKPEPQQIDDENWILRAAARARRLMRGGNSVFVSFAQPWIDHLVGLRLKRLNRRLPWVAHFSDPWVDSLYYDAGDPEVAAKLEVWRGQERAVVEQADALVFVTPETADLVMAKYPASLRGKVHVVPHGFDRRTQLASGARPSRAGGPFRMMYAGNIYEGRREPQPLFDALMDVDAGSPLKGRAEFLFYGNSPRATAEAAAARGLGDVVTFHGPVGYLDSLGLIADSDALLVLDAQAEVNVFMPSKIVDYLMTGRPILGLTPPRGASARILRETGHLAVDPGDRAAIAAAIRGLIAAHERGEAGGVPAPAAVEAFDIRRTTDRFEEALLFAMAARRR